MSIDYFLIGERIKEARKNKGWSQEKLAEEIDVATAYISRAERGHGANLKRLAQISEKLNVPLEYLVSGVITKAENYLSKELGELIEKCEPEKQKLIYNIAKSIVYNSAQQQK